MRKQRCLWPSLHSPGLSTSPSKWLNPFQIFGFWPLTALTPYHYTPPLKFSSLPLKRYRFTQKEAGSSILTSWNFRGELLNFRGVCHSSSDSFLWNLWKLIDSIITSIWIKSWKKLLIRNHLIRLVIRITWYSKLITWWFSSRPASHGCTQKQILLHREGCEENASIPRHSLPTTWWIDFGEICWVYVGCMMGIWYDWMIDLEKEWS